MSKIVLITGASGGLGQSMAAHLAAAGHIVYGTSRRPQVEAKEFQLLAADVTNQQSIAGAVGQILQQHGRLDVLINNAGLGIATPVETAPLEDVQRLWDTNVTGVLRTVQAVLPGMRQQRSGLIINISSIGAEIGLPYRGIYSASKAAVDRLTEALRTELAPFGVQACIIQPGGVQTNINQHRLTVNLPPDNVYKRSFEDTYQIIDSSVSKGLDSAVFGKLVVSILQEKEVRAVYRVGKRTERLSVVLKRLLPRPMFENMIKKHYKLK
jgi:NAD(P)-dependent dehydrogenase (short-subunit alcohol dehydrogenase family)